MYAIREVQRGNYDDRGYSNEETVAHLMLSKPSEINSMLTYTFGMDDAGSTGLDDFGDLGGADMFGDSEAEETEITPDGIEETPKKEGFLKKLSRILFGEDDEDEKSKFSVEELAIILDMDVEEIRDVLRLTGDDK